MDNKTRLYDLLDVKPKASPAQIKKAYRKAALKYHPDKNPDNPKAAEMFKEIQYANEILTNPETRGVYDMGGEPALAVHKATGMNIPPELLVVGTFGVGMCFCLTSILVLLFPVFLALEVDGSIDWTWPAVFFPVWFFDAIGFFVSVFILYSTFTDKTASVDDDGNPNDPPNKCMRLFYCLVFYCFILFHVLLALKMEGSVSFDWMVVFIPQIPVELGLFIMYCHISRQEVDPRDPITPLVRSFKTYTGIRSGLLRLLFMTFLVLKLDGVVDWGWTIVLLPVWLPWPIFLCCDSIGMYAFVVGKLPADTRAEAGEMLQMQIVSNVVTSLCSATCMIPFLVMLIDWLDNWSNGDTGITLGLVFVPIYILLSIFVLLAFCMCFASTCGGLFAVAEMEEKEEEFMADYKTQHHGDVKKEFDEAQKVVDAKAAEAAKNRAASEPALATHTLLPNETNASDNEIEMNYEDGDEMD